MSLLERIKAQDQAAWERLVSLYSPLVYLWCRKAGLQKADALDVGQEVFRAVARKIATFRREEGGTFRGWLFTITRSKVCDCLRGKRPDLTALGGEASQKLLRQVKAEDWDDAGISSEEDEKRILYNRAVELIRSQFSDKHWQAFWRTAVEEQRAAEVASALGMTANAVYAAKSRILRRLREEFADLVEEDLF